MPDSDIQKKEDTPQDEPLNYDEVHNQDLGDTIKETNAKPEEGVDETPSDEKTKSVDGAGDDTKDKDTKPDTEEPPAKTETAPALDPDKLKEEISQSTAEKIVEALAGEGKTAEEKKDLLADAPWVKEKREPTYEEALLFVKDTAKKELREELDREEQEAQQKEEEERKAQEEQQQNTIKQYNTLWDNELSDLETNGKIDKNPEQAKKMRLALFETMRDVNVKRAQENKPPILSLKEIYYEHYKAPTEQPAGADAPIAGVTKRTSTPNPKSFTYGEVHNSDFDDILTGK